MRIQQPIHWRVEGKVAVLLNRLPEWKRMIRKKSIKNPVESLKVDQKIEKRSPKRNIVVKEEVQNQSPDRDLREKNLKNLNTEDIDRRLSQNKKRKEEIKNQDLDPMKKKTIINFWPIIEIRFKMVQTKKGG